MSRLRRLQVAASLQPRGRGRGSSHVRGRGLYRKTSSHATASLLWRHEIRLKVACTHSWDCQMRCQSCGPSPYPALIHHKVFFLYGPVWRGMGGVSPRQTQAALPLGCGVIDDVSSNLPPFEQGAPPGPHSGAPRWCRPTSAAPPTPTAIA